MVTLSLTTKGIKSLSSEITEDSSEILKTVKFIPNHRKKD